jgi:hypothetical protein
MSRALPAVGSRRGGIPELLEARCLHRPGDHHGLAALVGALLDRPDELKAQARRNWGAASEFAGDVLDARRSALVARFAATVAARARTGAVPRTAEASLP